MFCLPRRIAEEDFPHTLLHGEDSRQACWPNSTCFENARVPMIAFFNWGHHQIAYDEDRTNMVSICVQPKIDRVFHLNWTRWRSEMSCWGYENHYPYSEQSAVQMLLHSAQIDYHMRASFVAELFHPFDLGELMGHPSKNARAAESRTPCVRLPRESEDGTAADLDQIIKPSTEPTVYATLIAISLYVNRRAAEVSGLFGLLGGAPVQIVDYDDIPQLRQFHKLFESGRALKEAEPHAEKLFDTILSPAFHAAVYSWLGKVEWRLQATI